jgi:hypothetical protein
MIEFTEFPKIFRLNREVIVTEKIDGTNAAVVIGEDGATIGAQSRSRMITVDEDNFGFARWVSDNRNDLLTLGPGHHFGEWWGAGIQRRYGQVNKRFSLFNVHRWGDVRPKCCDVVPVILRGMGFQTAYAALELLREHGSYAAQGFMQPEGIVAFHTQGNLMMKMTLLKDEEWKGKSSPSAKAVKP